MPPLPHRSPVPRGARPPYLPQRHVSPPSSPLFRLQPFISPRASFDTPTSSPLPSACPSASIHTKDRTCVASSSSSVCLDVSRGEENDCPILKPEPSSSSFMPPQLQRRYSILDGDTRSYQVFGNLETELLPMDIMSEPIDVSGGVWKAHVLDGEHKGEIVVLKHYAHDDEARKHEIEGFLRTVWHPNIVRALDTSNTEWTVLEYVGQSILDRVYKSRGDYELSSFGVRLINDHRLQVSIMHSLLEAIAHCAQCKVVHRDVKPSNILLRDLPCGEFHLKLADFDISAQIDDLGLPCDMSGIVQSGTPEYMPPECTWTNWVGVEPPPVAYPAYAYDVWSAAVVWIQIATGLPPFRTSRGQMDFSARRDEISEQQHTWLGTKALRTAMGHQPLALDLLEKMMVQDAGKRITALEALEHPIFLGGLGDVGYL